MSKIVLYAADKETAIPSLDSSKRRVTIQFRQYGADGKYEKAAEDDDTGNETIAVKGVDVHEVFEIVKAALLHSPHLSKRFKLE